MKKKEEIILTRSQYNDKMHSTGRLFTWIALGLILLVPVIYCLEAKVLPDGKAIVASLPYIRFFWTKRWRRPLMMSTSTSSATPPNMP